MQGSQPEPRPGDTSNQGMGSLSFLPFIVMDKLCPILARPERPGGAQSTAATRPKQDPDERGERDEEYSSDGDGDGVELRDSRSQDAAAIQSLTAHLRDTEQALEISQKQAKSDAENIRSLTTRLRDSESQAAATIQSLTTCLRSAEQGLAISQKQAKSDADKILSLTTRLRDEDERQAELSDTIQSLTTRLQYAEEDRAVLRSTLPQPDDFDRADIVNEFDLLENSVKSWCFEVFNFAVTHFKPGTPNMTPGEPHSLHLGADDVPLVSVRRWKSSGQFKQWFFYNLRSIVVRLILNHIFLPFHPSLLRSSSQPSPNANVEQDNLTDEFVRKLANRIEQTSARAIQKIDCT
jgi:hypothetical protein